MLGEFGVIIRFGTVVMTFRFINPRPELFIVEPYHPSHVVLTMITNGFRSVEFVRVFVQNRRFINCNVEPLLVFVHHVEEAMPNFLVDYFIYKIFRILRNSKYTP